MKNKLIVIEGTDCSGKETQTKLLVKKLNDMNIKIDRFQFPNYESATGKIIAGPYLGKEGFDQGYFKEGAANVEAKVASLYFAADRRYNLPYLKKELSKGHLILDRYVESNMAHQGGKITSFSERNKMFEWLEKLEYDLLELPKPDLTIFLYMPYEYGLKLKANRPEKLDQHEMSYENQINAEKCYLELCNKYNFKKIDCVVDGKIRTIEDINEELLNIVLNNL